MRKRFLGGFGLVAATALVGAISAAPASAAPCLPTPQGTAQLVDPAVVTGPVDATGCDIGVYYSATGAGAISNADIFGADKFGVFVDGGDVTIDDSQIHDISVPFDGVQQGVGVRYSNDATGSVTDSDIYRYQKNGFVIRGENTSVDTIGNTVSGLGKVAFIAQNGIQYDSGAAGTIADNLVRNHYYTGCSAKDAQKTGCTWTVATGILLFDVDSTEVKTTNNTYRDNQRNHTLITSSSVG